MDSINSTATSLTKKPGMFGTRLRLTFLLGCLLALFSTATAQKTLYSGWFEGIGDNREFFSRKSYSQTILASKVGFELGRAFDGHYVGAGLLHLYEFGTAIDLHIPSLTLYYRYHDAKKTFHFGSFPRTNLINLPLAMMADTVHYFRSHIEGLRGAYRWNNGHQYVLIDWTGKKSEFEREAFTVAAGGEIMGEHLFLRNYFLLNHLAHSELRPPGQHIRDNIGYAVQGGWRWGHLWEFELKAGILGSIYRERSVTDGIVHAKSLLTGMSMKFRNFKIDQTINSGEAHTFMTGDPFYRLNNYMRTDAIWYFINHPKVQGRFNLSFHLLDWKDLDQSQQISIRFILPD